MYRTQIAALMAACLLLAPAASAEDAPEDITQYRQLHMGAMGRHMGASKLILKGNVSRTDDLVGHATSLDALGKNLAALFPETTKPDGKLETEALPEIWKDAEGFAKAVKAYNTATANFIEVAKKGDLSKSMDAYGKVGQSCGGCHDSYRLDD